MEEKERPKPLEPAPPVPKIEEIVPLVVPDLTPSGIPPEQILAEIDATTKKQRQKKAKVKRSGGGRPREIPFRRDELTPEQLKDPEVVRNLVKCDVCRTEFLRNAKYRSCCTGICKRKGFLNKKSIENEMVRAIKDKRVTIIEEDTSKEHKRRRKLLPEYITTPRKHVDNENLFVNDFPAHDRGATDGVKSKYTELVYKPHPKQIIFSNAIEAGAKIIYFVAGIRSGKTFSLMWEVIKFLYVYDLKPNLGFLVSPTNQMLSTPRRIFESIAGDALVASKRSSDGGAAHFLMKPTRSIPDRLFCIEQHTGEHADRMRGPSIAFAAIDEAQLCKPEVMDVVRGRVLETGGIIALAGTATFPGHWTKTEILDRAYRCGICHTCVYDHYDLAKGDSPDGYECDEFGKETRRYVPKDHLPDKCYGDPRIAVITCSSFDNTHLDRDAIEQLKADYSMKDPIIARRELFAEYTGFEGLVYSRFDRRIHKSPYDVWNVPEDSYICAGIDFGANDPTACTIAARVKDTWHIIGEYCNDDRSNGIKEHVAGIKRAAGPVFNRIKNFWHDPSGRIAAMEMSRHGLRPMKAARKRKASGTTWLTYRIEVMNAHMMAKDEEGRPKLLINTEKCPNLVNNLENRKWKRYISRGDDGKSRVIDLRGKEVDRNAGDEPQPGNDHCSDSAEYSIVSEFVKGLYTIKNSQSNETIKDPSPVKVEPEVASIQQHLGSSLMGVVRDLRKPVKKGRLKPLW